MAEFVNLTLEEMSIFGQMAKQMRPHDHFTVRLSEFREDIEILRVQVGDFDAVIASLKTKGLVHEPIKGLIEFTTKGIGIARLQLRLMD